MQASNVFCSFGAQWSTIARPYLHRAQLSALTDNRRVCRLALSCSSVHSPNSLHSSDCSSWRSPVDKRPCEPLTFALTHCQSKCFAQNGTSEIHLRISELVWSLTCTDKWSNWKSPLKSAKAAFITALTSMVRALDGAKPSANKATMSLADKIIGWKDIRNQVHSCVRVVTVSHTSCLSQHPSHYFVNKWTFHRLVIFSRGTRF